MDMLKMLGYMRGWTRRERLDFALSAAMLVAFLTLLYAAMWIFY